MKEQTEWWLGTTINHLYKGLPDVFNFVIGNKQIYNFKIPIISILRKCLIFYEKKLSLIIR
jgi:hypothetical protein